LREAQFGHAQEIIMGSSSDPRSNCGTQRDYLASRVQIATTAPRDPPMNQTFHFELLAICKKSFDVSIPAHASLKLHYANIVSIGGEEAFRRQVLLSQFLQNPVVVGRLNRHIRFI
jgi:hypothetical protein